MIRTLVFCLCSLFIANPALATQPTLLAEPVIAALAQELSGETAILTSSPLG